MWLRSPRMKAPRVLSPLLYSSPFDHNNEEPRNPNTLCLCCPFSPLLRSTTHLSLAEQSSLSSADSPRSGHIGLRLCLDPPLRTQASPYLALQIDRRSSEAPVSISLPVPCPRSFPSFINLPPSSTSLRSSSLHRPPPAFFFSAISIATQPFAPGLPQIAADHHLADNASFIVIVYSHRCHEPNKVLLSSSVSAFVASPRRPHHLLSTQRPTPTTHFPPLFQCLTATTPQPVRFARG